ncbi:MAG: hypothetical protein HFG28_11715 [Eubacterium sp.]|nr:hypothetical protein [Eubacterium sp.]
MLKNLYIYESELCAMAYEAQKYPDCETGGDMYGLWTPSGEPVVFLATGPGKNAVRQDAHYQMDIEYEQKCATVLMKQFGIHYLGDWHSHHKLNINEPSLGDRDRIDKIFKRNKKINYMAEIIINHINEKNRKEMVSAYIYDKVIKSGNIKCLETQISPIRQKIKLSKEKQLFNLIGGKLPINCISLNNKEELGGIYNGYVEQSHSLSEGQTISIKLER